MDRAGAQGLHFFLQLELLSLEMSQSQGIRRGSPVFVLDRSIERLVTNVEFTNTGFNGHDRASMLLALEVNTSLGRLSDHKQVRTWLKGLAPLRWARNRGVRHQGG